jgi:Tfp pilus assembly protein PilZ
MLFKKIKMWYNYKIWWVIILTGFYSVAALSQNNDKKETIESFKVAFITQKLNLTTKEAQLFWPVYNEYLDKKNQEKYLSATAPDFVIFGIESTDNKYAIGDETMTLVALLQRYEPIKIRSTAHWQNRLLLKKKEQTKTLKLVKKSSAVWEMGKSFPLNSVIKADSSNHKLLSIIKVKTTYNWFGKLLNLFFRTQTNYVQMLFQVWKILS